MGSNALLCLVLCKSITVEKRLGWSPDTSLIPVFWRSHLLETTQHSLTSMKEDGKHSSGAEVRVVFMGGSQGH